MKRSKPKQLEKPFTTVHNLPFTSCPWHRDHDWNVFKIGTCEGQWRAFHGNYEILSIINNSPGNGHLEDVFQWFFHYCRRDGRGLRLLEIMNENFKKYLIEKRGFVEDGVNCIKKFK